MLEVGCRTGKWLAELVAAGADVAGLDASAEMLARARKVVEGDLQLGVAECLPWTESTFDAVLYVNALHPSFRLVANLVIYATAARKPGRPSSPAC